MKPCATLVCQRPTPCRLRSIGEGDIERLRVWKNAHREFFFHKEIITPEQQAAWYGRWSQSAHDHLFVAEVDGRPVGCAGVRLFDGTADAYNIILGDKALAGRGIMSAVLDGVCAFAGLLYPGLAVRVRVLAVNPAIGWYKKNGFVTIAENAEYVTMEQRRTVLGECTCDLRLSLPFHRQ